MSHYSSQSFEIKLELQNDAIMAGKSAAGLMLFITNHTEQKGRCHQLSASQIIDHYRVKKRDRELTSELKSFLNLRPVHVGTEEHVRAHFDIADYRLLF